MIHLLSIAVLSLFLSMVATAQAAEEKLPVAISGNVAGDSASTRFFIEFDANLPVQTFYMDEPDRIIIDIGEADFTQVEAGELKPRGLVSDIQFGRIAKGRSRIVLSLQQPAEIIKASMSKRLDGETFRFLLDIDSTDRKTYAALLEEQRKTIGDSGLKAQKGDRVRPPEKKSGAFTIVLDPGHGGIDGGAKGKSGTREKDVVLGFAQRLQKRLAGAGPFHIELTRDEDVFMSLKDRLAFGRKLKADLFISIHADSLRQGSVRGSTIYTLSKKASDRLSAQLAESENSVDLIAGLAVEEEEAEILTDILADLTTRETKRFSRRFSDLLLENLERQVRLIKNPQRSASFGVLKAPEVPSVLLELGYLSNPEDEKLLIDPSWQNKAVEAITDAVLSFFKYRLQQQGG